MTPAPTQSQHRGKRLTSPARSAHSLLVVKSHGRHVSKHNGLQITDVHTYFHGGRNTKQVNRINERDWRASSICFSLHHNISEASLTAWLIVSLSRQFFAMESQGNTTLNSLVCVVVSAVKFMALCIRFAVYLPEATRADPGCAVHVDTLTRRTDPDWIVLKPEPHKKTMCLQFRTFMSTCLANRMPRAIEKR